MLINLSGLLTVLIASALAGLIHLVYPFLHLPHRLLGIGACLTAVGMVADFLGKQTRFLLAPPWLYGWLLMSIGAWQYGGWLLGLGTLSGLFVLIIGLAVLMFGAEKKYWDAAPGRLQEAQEALDRGDTKQAWEHLRSSIIFTRTLPMETEMHTHNRKVIATIAQATGELPPELQLRFKHLDEMMRAAEEGKPLEDDQKHRENLALLNHLLTTEGDLSSLGVLSSQSQQEHQTAIAQYLDEKKKTSLPPPPPDKLR